MNPTGVRHLYSNRVCSANIQPSNGSTLRSTNRTTITKAHDVLRLKCKKDSSMVVFGLIGDGRLYSLFKMSQ